MNIKKGIGRIFLAIGYLLFILLGLAIASNEGNYLITIIGGIVGFFVFKGLILGLQWIINGFKNDELNK